MRLVASLTVTPVFPATLISTIAQVGFSESVAEGGICKNA